MENQLFLITLEDLETRYTSQWRRWIKKYLSNAGINYYEINGDIETNIQGENFLNPNTTNIWKSEQIIKLSKLFENNQIKNGDRFLFYDAWHYGIIALRYMSIVNNIPIKIFGMWHAGSYDKTDILGYRDKKEYLLPFEKSLVRNLDKSFVATNYHRKLMLDRLKISDTKKVISTGFPYNFDELDKYKIPYSEKENIVVFPHRISKEKNPELLKKIAKHIHGKVIYSQEKKLSKNEYHKLLARSKIVFSASDHENWGLGVFESMYLGCVPVIPDRLSYKEMYNKIFRYPKSKENIHNLSIKINYFLKNYEFYNKILNDNIKFLKETFCTFNNIIKEIN